jgi:hypothetical protein
MAEALPVHDLRMRRLGRDLLFSGRPAPKGARSSRVD